MPVADNAYTVARMARAAVDHRVQYLILFVTARCNLLCKHCFYTDEILNWQAKKELSAEEYERIAEHAGSVLQVSLTGGEPFIRRDLDRIILAFHERARTLFFNVTTNGLLQKPILSTLESIYAQAPGLTLRLGLSVDGFEAVHDLTRDRQGAFRKTLETAKALQELRARHPHFTVHVSTTLTKHNAATIEAFIDFVREEMEVDAHYLGYVRGNAMDPETKEVTVADYQRATAHLKRRWIAKSPYQNVLNGLNALMCSVNSWTLEGGGGDRYFFPCVAGEKLLTIDEEGKVKPCEILEQIGVTPYIMGELRAHEYDLYQVLATDEARRIRARILDSKCRCTFECANQASIAYRPANFVKAAALHLRRSAGL